MRRSVLAEIIHQVLYELGFLLCLQIVLLPLIPSLSPTCSMFHFSLCDFSHLAYIKLSLVASSPIYFVPGHQVKLCDSILISFQMSYPAMFHERNTGI